MIKVARKRLGPSDIKVVRKTSDQTVNNSDTLEDDDELLFAIGASEVWFVTLVILYNSPATPDIKFQWTLPSGGVLHWLYENSRDQTYTITTKGIGTASAGTDAIWTAYYLMTNGSTAGNAQLQWAQNVQNASDTKVLLDSCIIANKVS